MWSYDDVLESIDSMIFETYMKAILVCHMRPSSPLDFGGWWLPDELAGFSQISSGKLFK
jgi:hypothetical protein